MLNEIDALLDICTLGIVTHEGDDAALVERLDEWLFTPRGTIYGYPNWGTGCHVLNINLLIPLLPFK